MFKNLGVEASFPYKTAYSGLRFLWSLLKGRLASSPQSDAMIRTTIAPTMLEGSEKENVMPQVVRAVVNLRILQGETRESVTARVRSVINDPEVAIAARENSSEPSPVSGTGSPHYAALKETIMSLFPGTVVAPFLMSGATDSRHFTKVSGQVFRFTPARIGSEDMVRVHGVNECISVGNFAEVIAFYAEFIRRTAR